MSHVITFEELTQEQRDFITYKGNSHMFACPGSGKTLTIAHKFIYYAQSWTNQSAGVAILSFTNVAKDEVIKTTKGITSTNDFIGYPHIISTLDGFIDRFILLRFAYYSQIFRDLHPNILQKDEDYPPLFTKNPLCNKNTCVSHPTSLIWKEDGLHKRKPYSNETVLVSNYCNDKGKYCLPYKTQLLKKGIISQEETQFFSNKVLQENTGIAKIIANRFPVILVDEAQDCSKSQIQILKTILENGLQELVIVGDDDQSLYEWREAIPGYLSNFAKRNNFTEFELTENYRSSQNICNATQLFSERLKTKSPSKAKGDFALSPIRPKLILYNSYDDKKVEIDFFSYLLQLGFDCANEMIAILSRGRPEPDFDISSIWFGVDIRRLDKAQYLMRNGRAKEGYLLAERAYFNMFNADVKGVGQQDLKTVIEKTGSYSDWKSDVTKFLLNLPSSELLVPEWEKAVIDQAKTKTLRANYDINNLRSKKRLKTLSDFKSKKIKDLRETQMSSNIVKSTVHGVKGQTFRAVLLKIKSPSSNITLSTKSINELELSNELIKIAYVAMTRASEVLVVAMPKSNQIPRFPHSYWDIETR
jgi:DNA helicase-2/ATP-dependent DNA helicase PcrA